MCDAGYRHPPHDGRQGEIVRPISSSTGREGRRTVLPGHVACALPGGPGSPRGRRRAQRGPPSRTRCSVRAGGAEALVVGDDDRPAAGQRLPHRQQLHLGATRERGRRRAPVVQAVRAHDVGHQRAFPLGRATALPGSGPTGRGTPAPGPRRPTIPAGPRRARPTPSMERKQGHGRQRDQSTAAEVSIPVVLTRRAMPSVRSPEPLLDRDRRASSVPPRPAISRRSAPVSAAPLGPTHPRPRCSWWPPPRWLSGRPRRSAGPPCGPQGPPWSRPHRRGLQSPTTARPRSAARAAVGSYSGRRDGTACGRPV